MKYLFCIIMIVSIYQIKTAQINKTKEDVLTQKITNFFDGNKIHCLFLYRVTFDVKYQEVFDEYKELLNEANLLNSQKALELFKLKDRFQVGKSFGNNLLKIPLKKEESTVDSYI